MPRTQLAHVYRALIFILGLGVLLVITTPATLIPHAFDLLLFLIVSLAVKRAGFHVSPRTTHSLVGVVDLAALMIYGPAAGGWVAALSAALHVLGVYARHRTPPFRLMLSLAGFRFGLKALMAVGGAALYVALGGRYAPDSFALTDLVPVVGLALAWFVADHAAWVLGEAIERGRAHAQEFTRSIMRASLLVELLPLPLSGLLVYQFVTLDRGVFVLIAFGIIVVSIVVQRVADLSQAYRKREMELQTLNDFGRALSAARLDEAQILELVYRYSSRVTDTSNFAISLIDEQTNEVDLAIWYREGKRRPARHYAQWGGLAGWVVKQRRALLAYDVLSEPLPVRGLLLTAQQTRSALFVPLLTKDKVIGVVSVQSHLPHTFTLDHERLFIAMANQAAVEIEQARLYRAQQRRTRQLETIAEVSQRVAGIFDLDELMEFVTALIKINFQYYHVDIYLVRGDRLIHTAGTVPGRQPHGFEYIEQTSLISTVATMGQALLVNDVEKEPRYRYDAAAPRTAAELVVPLKAEGKLQGVLEVQADQKNSFSESDVYVMQTLADQVALAILEARLFASVQQEAYVSNALLQVADAVGGLNDVHEIMSTVVRIIPLLAGVDRCLALRSDPQKQLLIGDASYGLPRGCAAEWAALRVPYHKLFFEGQPPGNSGPRHILLPELLSEQFSMREALLLPMLVRGSFLGALCVDGHVPPDSRVLSLLAGIANQTGLALEAVQIEGERDLRARIDQELMIGRTIQSSLLPQTVPQIEGFDLAAEWRPALEVAGDFFDHIPLADGRWGFVVADVSDKGVPAAIYMTLARTIIRAIGLGKATRRTPRQVLERANEIIMADSRTDLFVTTFYAVLDPPTRILRYASAGHCPPLLWHAHSQTSEWLTGHGLPLGVLDSITLEEHEIQLHPDDLVVFYTDGVTEAFNMTDELFGSERLRYTVAGAQDMDAKAVLDAIMQAVEAFAGQRELMDDLTMVVLRCL